LAIVGVYMPSRERSARNVAKKRSFIRSFLDGLRQIPPVTRNRLLVAGDYNAVSRRHIPAHPGFIDCEYELHEELERLGFISGHELADFRNHPYSWVGRTGHGYLYDYFHLGRALHGRFRSCRYLDGTRRSGLSDHSAVSVALA
jgi:exodeoxyribonuclease III